MEQPARRQRWEVEPLTSVIDDRVLDAPSPQHPVPYVIYHREDTVPVAFRFLDEFHVDLMGIEPMSAHPPGTGPSSFCGAAGNCPRVQEDINQSMYERPGLSSGTWGTKLPSPPPPVTVSFDRLL